MKNTIIKYSKAGAAHTQNIHLHPVCTFQDKRKFSVEIIGLAINQLTICADRMPNTVVNWFMETNLPLMAAGEISEIYMGDMVDAIPIAIPPKIL
jgi:hypothetical protein